MSPTDELANPRPALFMRMLSYELAVTISLVVAWVGILGVADLRVLVTLMALRFVGLGALLVGVLAPVQRWVEGGRSLSDDELLAAEAALSRGGQARFVWVFVLSWPLTLGLATLLAYFGVPRHLPMGEAELMISGLFALAVSVPAHAIIQALWAGACVESRAQLGVVLGERDLGRARPRSSLVSSLLVLAMATTMGVFLGVATLGGMVRVRALRDQALLEQRLKVEVAAAGFEEGAALPEGLELVAGSELPAALGELAAADLAAGRALEAEAVNDLDRGQTLAAAPLPGDRWIVAAAETDEELELFWLFLVVVGVAIAVPLLVAVSSYGRAFSSQLRALRRATRRVVEDGELRSTDQVIGLENDEIGDLVEDFNAMLGMFEELSIVAQRVAEGDLRVELERPGDLHDAFREMVDRLRNMVVQIRESATELATAAAQIRTVVSEQEYAAERQSVSVREAGSVAASLTKSAQEIADAARYVFADAELARGTTDTVAKKIAELRAEATGVATLLEIIREVADRSDLLALNGSLEATRAGEAGRGFSLVAAEMRRLAERVTGTVGDVRSRVESIDQAGASTVMATDESRALAESTATAARRISTLTEQQSVDTEQVSTTIGEVAEAAAATTEATGQTRAAAQQLATEAERLEQLTGRFRLD